MTKNEMAAKLQDAMHYAMFACARSMYEGNESTFVGRQDPGFSKSYAFRAAYRIARECFGNDMPTIRKPNLGKGDAELLCAYISELARERGIDAYHGRVKSSIVLKNVRPRWSTTWCDRRICPVNCRECLALIRRDSMRLVTA